MWTAESVATLRQLWADGMSASCIAHELGSTRNAVMGKVDRLNLKPRTTRLRRRPTRRPTQRNVEAAALEADLPVIVRTRRPTKPQLSKSDLRRMLAQAWHNTAALPVSES